MLYKLKPFPLNTKLFGREWGNYWCNWRTANPQYKYINVHYIKVELLAGIIKETHV